MRPSLDTRSCRSLRHPRGPGPHHGDPIRPSSPTKEAPDKRHVWFADTHVSYLQTKRSRSPVPGWQSQALPCWVSTRRERTKERIGTRLDSNLTVHLSIPLSGRKHEAILIWTTSAMARERGLSPSILVYSAGRTARPDLRVSNQRTTGILELGELCGGGLVDESADQASLVGKGRLDEGT